MSHLLSPRWCWSELDFRASYVYTEEEWREVCVERLVQSKVQGDNREVTSQPSVALVFSLEILSSWRIDSPMPKVLEPTHGQTQAHSCRSEK